ncbi:hypothetical protein BC628DRAFT_440862 [Trametes gibbosa]|nr:hypothetical protein BC628DRAFT_440862 [Trametes gibbosa]
MLARSIRNKAPLPTHFRALDTSPWKVLCVCRASSPAGCGRPRRLPVGAAKLSLSVSGYFSGGARACTTQTPPRHPSALQKVARRAELGSSCFGANGCIRGIFGRSPCWHAECADARRREGRTRPRPGHKPMGIKATSTCPLPDVPSQAVVSDVTLAYGPPRFVSNAQWIWTNHRCGCARSSTVHSPKAMKTCIDFSAPEACRLNCPFPSSEAPSMCASRILRLAVQPFRGSLGSGWKPPEW